MADEREDFQVAVHRMRDAFVAVREVTSWDERERLTGEFFEGYAAAKRLFGTVLLQRDVLGGRMGCSLQVFLLT